MIDPSTSLVPLRAAAVSLLGFTVAGCAGCFPSSGAPAQAQWAPMPLQAAHLDESTLVPATTQITQPRTVQFIVKVKDGEAEALTRLYFRDEAAARASFADWASDKPLFRSMDLVACSYSGELVLRPAAASAAGEGADFDGVLAALRAHPLVSYADRDFVAQIERGGGREE